MLCNTSRTLGLAFCRKMSKKGVIVARIAAHVADLVKGIKRGLGMGLGNGQSPQEAGLGKTERILRNLLYRLLNCEGGKIRDG